jgi:hypothetical protein
MATRLMLQRAKGEPTRYAYVSHCPLFEDPDTDEVKELLTDGWRVVGHVDGEDGE